MKWLAVPTLAGLCRSSIRRPRRSLPSRLRGTRRRYLRAARRFFDQCVGDPLRDLPLLIGGAACEHRDLNHRHKSPYPNRCAGVPPLSCERSRPHTGPPRRRRYNYFANSYPAKKKLSSKRAVSSASEP